MRLQDPGIRDVKIWKKLKRPITVCNYHGWNLILTGCTASVQYIDQQQISTFNPLLVAVLFGKPGCELVCTRSWNPICLRRITWIQLVNLAMR